MARARDAVWLLVACACGASIGLAPVLALGILPGGGTEHAAPVRFAVARAGVRSDSPSKLISVPAQAGRATLRLHRTPAINSRPTGLIGDGHSGYWFTEQGSDMVGHVSEGGHFREYRVPTKGSQPVALALDASGNVWFTKLTAGKLGRIDSGGHISEFALRYSSAQPYALALRRS